MKLDNITIIDHSWRLDAECKDIDQTIFYTDENDPKSPEADTALQICAACIVRNECLETALINNEQYGIWGGMRPKERGRQRRKLGYTSL